MTELFEDPILCPKLPELGKHVYSRLVTEEYVRVYL